MKMYRNKKDVDKHVENLISKLSVKEVSIFILRCRFCRSCLQGLWRFTYQMLFSVQNTGIFYRSTILWGRWLRKLSEIRWAIPYPEGQQCGGLQTPRTSITKIGTKGESSWTIQNFSRYRPNSDQYYFGQ